MLNHGQYSFEYSEMDIFLQSHTHAAHIEMHIHKFIPRSICLIYALTLVL